MTCSVSSCEKSTAPPQSMYLSLYERVSEKIKTVGNTKIDGTRINMWTVVGAPTEPVKMLPDFADDADDGYLTL